MPIQNSYIQFNNYINVNSIKVEKLEKQINQKSGIGTIILKSFSEVTNEEIRDNTSINTIFFTTFNIDSETTVEAYYFPPEN